MTNLNEDPILSYVICYFLGESLTSIGSSDECEIQFKGLNILPIHATIVNESDKVILKPEIGAKIKVNGNLLNGGDLELANNDRVLFGKTFFLF